eukprot:Tbor_TRINITY_DN5351_c3_g2::TRINITY_DN5351_c3_g2_i1::g.3838::m.3838
MRSLLFRDISLVAATPVVSFVKPSIINNNNNKTSNNTMMIDTSASLDMSLPFYQTTSNTSNIDNNMSYHKFYSIPHTIPSTDLTTSSFMIRSQIDNIITHNTITISKRNQSSASSLTSPHPSVAPVSNAATSRSTDLVQQYNNNNNDNNDNSGGTVPVLFSPGSGPGGALSAPVTAITGHCDILSECLTKADEIKMQMKAQEASDMTQHVLTSENMEECMKELKATATGEITAIVESMKTSSVALQTAGMHELRRTLFYATQLKERTWLEEAEYTTMMRGLTVEFLRRDNEGVLASDDVLYITTHMVVSNFYNRHLWNRMETSLCKWSNYENIEMSSIKSLSTRMFKTRRGCAKETLDVRRKILNAMSRRVGVLANDFDLPSLLGVLQCYTVHDLMPRFLEPLAHRATNHVNDFTPHECATLSQILRKWRLMRLEVCEKIVERISTSDQLTHHMAISALLCIKTCYTRISDGGRNAMNADPMRQKLRAMGEQIGCRLDEVTYPALPVILQVLDVIVTMKIYVPKKCLQSIFSQANNMIAVVTDTTQEEQIDPKTGKRVRPITAEEARQLQALLYHYGSDLSAELGERLKNAFKEGLLPDEASVF